MIKYFILFLCFATTAMCFALPPLPVGGGSNLKLARSPGTYELVRLGEVNNKTYYAENTGYTNWTQAKALCESQDMMLATIETEAEVKFLSGNFPPGDFDILYWTAAQDSQLLSQLRWKKGDEQTEITEQIPLYITDFVTPPLSCGVILSYFGNLSLNLLPCGYSDFITGTLCQTK